MDNTIRINVSIDGISSACIYQYIDDLSSIYFSNIVVSEDKRRNGIGTKLLRTIESFGKSLCAKQAYLWVRKNTYQYDWYCHNGYKYYQDHDLPDYIWMRKDIGDTGTI